MRIDWLDSNEAAGGRFLAFRARAELIAGICSEIRMAIEGLPRIGGNGKGPALAGNGRRTVEQHATELVQQLSEMGQLARRLMDTTIEAEALGTAYTEESIEL